MAVAPTLPYRAGGDGAGAFNSPIPKSATADADSARVTAHMLRDMAAERCFLAPGAAVYTAAPGDPLWDVRCDGRHVAHVHGPKNPVPGTPDADMPLVLVDPAIASKSGEVPAVRCWRATVNPAARTIDTQGWGLFDRGQCSDGLPIAGWGTGCGLSSDVGLITAQDLEYGRIDHALRLVGPDWISGTRYRLPARRSDQHGDGPVTMGMRVQLRVTDQEIENRTVPGDDVRSRTVLWMICRALRDYGAIVVDGSGSDTLWGLLLEGPAARTADLLGHPAGGYAGNIIRDLRASKTGDRSRRATDGVPWDRAVILDRSWWPA